MPIEINNSYDFKEYKIDYSNWREELSRLKIFNDKKIQEKYLDTWMEVLRKSDNASVEFFSKPKNKLLAIKERNEAPEIYQQTIVYNSNTVYVHFRVSRILQVIEGNGGNEKHIQKIDLKKFIEKKSIDWTETDIYSDVKDTPILLVPFNIGQYIQSVVIDGNHRITAAIMNKKREIEGIYLNPQSIVENNLFCSDFDKLMYVFHNELIWVGSNCILEKNNHDDIEILKNTYFMSGKVNIWGQS